MAGSRRVDRQQALFEGLINVLDTVARLNRNGTATPAELAVGREANRFLLSFAELVESHMSGTPSREDRAMLDRIRHYCGHYELRLWRTEPKFSCY
jgi:hypothetical protein